MAHMDRYNINFLWSKVRFFGIMEDISCIKVPYVTMTKFFGQTFENHLMVKKNCMRASFYLDPENLPPTSRS